MKNNKGFISTSIIFAFFITFLLLLVIIITSYAQNRILMNQVKKDIKSNLVSKYEYYESNFIKACTYNQTSGASNYCVTGDEDTCEETTCYKNTTVGSCKAGDIIKYKVNNKDIINFHVMYDNGDTLTMQTQKNIVYNTAWGSSYNTSGPTVILAELESQTFDWSNVITQTYTMGTTGFSGKGSFTGCSPYNKCEINTYILTEKSAKARIITSQEAADLGCTNMQKTCPIWMYNYLYNSTSYGGTVNEVSKDTESSYKNWGYWTMNADSSSNNKTWIIDYDSCLYSDIVSDLHRGARAVVEVSK